MSDEFDFYLPELRDVELVQLAEHGDLAPLIALLRSDVPLSRTARDYLADELEREPRKRFLQRSREKLELKKKDRRLLAMVRHEKIMLAYAQAPEGSEDERWDYAVTCSPSAPMAQI